MEEGRIWAFLGKGELSEERMLLSLSLSDRDQAVRQQKKKKKKKEEKKEEKEKGRGTSSKWRGFGAILKRDSFLAPKKKEAEEGLHIFSSLYTLCMYVCMYVCAYVMYVCMYVCMH